MMYFVTTYIRMRLDSETSVLLPFSVLQNQSLRCLGAASYLLEASRQVLGESWAGVGVFQTVTGGSKKASWSHRALAAKRDQMVTYYYRI